MEFAIEIARDRDDGIDSWCVFDNTASGAALEDALKMRSLMVRAWPQ